MPIFARPQIGLAPSVGELRPENEAHSLAPLKGVSKKQMTSSPSSPSPCSQMASSSPSSCSTCSSGDEEVKAVYFCAIVECFSFARALDASKCPSDAIAPLGLGALQTVTTSWLNGEGTTSTRGVAKTRCIPGHERMRLLKHITPYDDIVLASKENLSFLADLWETREEFRTERAMLARAGVDAAALTRSCAKRACDPNETEPVAQKMCLGL